MIPYGLLLMVGFGSDRLWLVGLVQAVLAFSSCILQSKVSFYFFSTYAPGHIDGVGQADRYLRGMLG